MTSRSTKTRRLLIIGDTGNLSLEIQKQVKAFSSCFSFNVLETAKVKDLWTTRELGRVIREWSKKTSEGSWLINTCGITNPSSPMKELLDVNVDLNLFLYEIAKSNRQNFVSIGTVMENFPKISFNNPYLLSKFYSFQELVASKDNDYLHLQIHTLYGGAKLKHNMFLTQLFNAVNNKEDFHMSTGIQLREYHHIRDDVDIILRLLCSNSKGVRTLSSGKPVKLIDLANHVYATFLPQRQIFFDLPIPAKEQLDYTFAAMEQFDEVPIFFRDSFLGITEDFRRRLK